MTSHEDSNMQPGQINLMQNFGGCKWSHGHHPAAVVKHNDDETAYGTVNVCYSAMFCISELTFG